MGKEMKILKAQKTKLLNRKCESLEEFEIIQDKLNEVELDMMSLQNETHIPHIN